MKHPNKEQWSNAVKKAVSDTGAKPSSGPPTVIASARIVRDQLVAAMAEHKPKNTGEAIELVKRELNELIGEVSNPKGDGVQWGFMSNASAAAKAAGFETEAEKLVKLVE